MARLRRPDCRQRPHISVTLLTRELDGRHPSIILGLGLPRTFSRGYTEPLDLNCEPDAWPVSLGPLTDMTTCSLAGMAAEAWESKPKQRITFAHVLFLE